MLPNGRFKSKMDYRGMMVRLTHKTIGTELATVSWKQQPNSTGVGVVTPRTSLDRNLRVSLALLLIADTSGHTKNDGDSSYPFPPFLSWVVPLRIRRKQQHSTMLLLGTVIGPLSFRSTWSPSWFYHLFTVGRLGMLFLARTKSCIKSAWEWPLHGLK
jgi:hypothetical protein